MKTSDKLLIGLFVYLFAFALTSLIVIRSLVNDAIQNNNPQEQIDLPNE